MVGNRPKVAWHAQPEGLQRAPAYSEEPAPRRRSCLHATAWRHRPRCCLGPAAPRRGSPCALVPLALALGAAASASRRRRPWRPRPAGPSRRLARSRPPAAAREGVRCRSRTGPPPPAPRGRQRSTSCRSSSASWCIEPVLLVCVVSHRHPCCDMPQLKECEEVWPTNSVRLRPNGGAPVDVGCGHSGDSSGAPPRGRRLGLERSVAGGGSPDAVVPSPAVPPPGGRCRRG